MEEERTCPGLEMVSNMEDVFWGDSFRSDSNGDSSVHDIPKIRKPKIQTNENKVFLYMTIFESE